MCVSLSSVWYLGSVPGVPQVVLQQLGGSVLEGLGQRSQQHGELWGVELEQGDQHHLGGLSKQIIDDYKSNRPMARGIFFAEVIVVFWYWLCHLSENHLVLAFGELYIAE